MLPTATNFKNTGSILTQRETRNISLFLRVLTVKKMIYKKTFACLQQEIHCKSFKMQVAKQWVLMHGKALANWSLLTQYFTTHRTVVLPIYHTLLIMHHVIFNSFCSNTATSRCKDCVLWLPHTFQAMVQLLAEVGNC
jgi:hypothetical protein